MSVRQEVMAFRYKALFQNLDIRFYKTQKEKSFLIDCEAEIKLPVLKKSYVTATEFTDSYTSWIRHAPVREKGIEEKWIEKDFSNQKALDPVGFFMQFEEDNWSEPQVQLLIGAKVVTLVVDKIVDGFEICRAEKNQKLRLIKGKERIQRIELPLPMIGAVGVERVWV